MRPPPPLGAVVDLDPMTVCTVSAVVSAHNLRGWQVSRAN